MEDTGELLPCKFLVIQSTRNNNNHEQQSVIATRQVDSSPAKLPSKTMTSTRRKSTTMNNQKFQSQYKTGELLPCQILHRRQKDTSKEINSIRQVDSSPAKYEQISRERTKETRKFFSCQKFKNKYPQIPARIHKTGRHLSWPDKRFSCQQFKQVSPDTCEKSQSRKTPLLQYSKLAHPSLDRCGSLSQKAWAKMAWAKMATEGMIVKVPFRQKEGEPSNTSGRGYWAYTWKFRWLCRVPLSIYSWRVAWRGGKKREERVCVGWGGENN